MDIWVVEIMQIQTGSRIEGFDVRNAIFTNREKSIAFAWSEAQKYHEQSRLNETLYFDNSGEYILGISAFGEEWAGFRSTITRMQFDPDAEISLDILSGT